MKFLCKKCRHPLTKDLFLTKKLVNETIVYPETGEDDPEYINYKFTIKEGSFKKYSYSYYDGEIIKRFSINRNDAVGCFLYPYMTGSGCCDNHGIAIECGKCFTVVGVEYMDCYDTLESVELYPTAVLRDNTNKISSEDFSEEHKKRLDAFIAKRQIWIDSLGSRKQGE